MQRCRWVKHRRIWMSIAKGIPMASATGAGVAPRIAADKESIGDGRQSSCDLEVFLVCHSPKLIKDNMQCQFVVNSNVGGSFCMGRIAETGSSQPGRCISALSHHASMRRLSLFS